MHKVVMFRNTTLTPFLLVGVEKGFVFEIIDSGQGSA